jgi:hypothetical protein
VSKRLANRHIVLKGYKYDGVGGAME